MLFPIPTSRSAQRVVVTGAGIVTALGTGWQINAAGFCAGRPAIRPVTLFDVSRQRTRIAAEVDLPRELPVTRMSGKSRGRLDRASQMLLHAAHEAWSQAGWLPEENLPVVLGTTSGEMSLGEAYLRQAINSARHFKKQATRVAGYQVQRQGLDLCDAFGFQGPITVISNACASGANAIGRACS